MALANCPVSHRLHRIAVLLSSFCAISPIAAHDFWVQPNEYWLGPATPIPVTLQVGHGPFRQRSPIPLSRITRFQALSPNGAVIELRGNLRLGEGAKDGDIEFADAGTYVVVLETDARAQSHLPAIRFNDYLKVEGLTPASRQRQREHRMDRDGSENYARCAKSLLQVGPPSAATPAQLLKPVGLPLEIVTEENPYAEPRPAKLTVQVLYEGRPLGGALAKLTNLEHDEAPFEMQVTDDAGRASFTMPRSGSWLLNVIWTKVLPASRETDYETVFSSLSFGFPTRGP